VPPDFQEIRGVLTRVVASICPLWLAADRDDIVQNACMRLMKLADEREQSEGFSSSYLWKVAHSVTMDEIRRRMRRREVDENDAPPEPAGDPEARREIGEAVVQGLQELDEPRRRAVALHLFGYGLEESARMLGWDVKRLANLRYRGLEQLRQLLRSKGVDR